MGTRLAQFDTEALDLADTEALANQGVDIDTAHGHLPPSLAGPQSDVLDDLSRNKR